MKDFSNREASSLLEVIDQLARCRNISSFENGFKGLSVLLPYEISLCVVVDSISLTIDKLINNKFPFGISFVQKMAQDNPFVSETISLMRPRFWDMKDYKFKKVARFKNDSGLTRGLSSAFSEPGGKITYLCLSKPVEKPHQRHLQIVDFLMPHLHHTFNRLYKPCSKDGFLPSLSHRESEILKWVTEGKTNWEISEIVGISEATVKFHLLNIFRKLDVVNRGHAVAKALQSGIC